MNEVRVSGWLGNLRQRWTPDGSQAVIAELSASRPPLGPQRASVEERQPLPLRASGEAAAQLAALENRYVRIEGVLRRRFYRRDGESRWGQVEIWVTHCDLLPEPKGLQSEEKEK